MTRSLLLSLSPFLLLLLPVLAHAVVTPEMLRPEGLRVSVLPYGRVLEIDPLPVLHYECDGQLTVGAPGWRGDFLLPKTAWTFRALRRGSLVVTRADDPKTQLVEGKDYVVDWDWGSLNALSTSAIAAGTKLHFAYDYTLSRLDLVEQTPKGELVLRKGVEDMSKPLLPTPGEGNVPLFSVYLPHNTTALTLANLYVIDPTYRGVPPVSGTEALAPVLAKLNGSDPVVIAFFGDSITAQLPADFRDGKGSYVDRMVAYLRTRYPSRSVVVTPKETVVPPAPRQLVVVKAGVGGDDSGDGLKRIETDVLAHHPDLVVIMFGANDENRAEKGNNVPVAEYRRNLATMVTAIRKAGGEPVLMTTSMKNLGWVGTVGNLNEYAAAVRTLAAEQKVCLVDNFRAWEALPTRGYNYMILLDSCINHPNDLGHEVFFEGLRAAFEAGATG